MPLIQDRKYWLSWTLTCGLGEFLGITTAACITVYTNGFIGEPQSFNQKALVILFAVINGVVEGLITGYFQWYILRRKFVNMKAKDWVHFTMLGAAVGWSLGVLPSTFFASGPSATGDIAELPLLLIILLAMIAGLAIGMLFGAFQWLELRKHTSKATRWILANALAWGVGMAIIFVGASSPSANTGLAVIILIGGLSGLLAGLSVGAITGLFLPGMTPK